MIYPSYSWPKDPRSLGLEEIECSIISDIITFVRSRIESPLGWQYIKAQDTVSTTDGYNLTSPRKIIIHHYFSIVQLKIPADQKRTMQSLGRVWQKFGYNPDHGEVLIKKNILEPNQYLLLQYLKDSPSSSVKNGLSKIVYFSTIRGKYRYFQKYYVEGSLATSYLKGDFIFNKMAVLDLQNTLARIHEISLTPAKIESRALKDALKLGAPCMGYHGNIAPSHIFCEVGNLKLGGFSAALRIHVMTINWGWSSPESIRAFKSEVDPSKFNIEYGAKADVWSFALIAIGFVTESFYVHDKINDLIFPPLPCIYSKITVDETGSVCAEAIGSLTQEEIDRDLDDIKPVDETGEEYIFWSAAKEWLQVDPDKRPSFSEILIDLSDQPLV